MYDFRLTLVLDSQLVPLGKMVSSTFSIPYFPVGFCLGLRPCELFPFCVCWSCPCLGYVQAAYV